MKHELLYKQLMVPQTLKVNETITVLIEICLASIDTFVVNFLTAGMNFTEIIITSED